MTKEYLLWFRAAGTPTAGLSPTWINFWRMSDKTAQLGSAPVITELGGGLYTYSWDAYANGQHAGIIDGGAILTPADRYVPVDLDPGDAAVDFFQRVLKGEKGIEDAGGGVYHLVSYDPADGVTELLRKPLKDIDRNDINDLLSGRLAIEEASSV